MSVSLTHIKEARSTLAKIKRVQVNLFVTFGIGCEDALALSIRISSLTTKQDRNSNPCQH